MSGARTPDIVRKRVDMLRMVFGFCLMSVLAVLAYFQILHCREYRARADRNRFKKLSIKPERGLIRDRNGKILAKSRPLYRLHFLGEDATHPSKSIREASEILNLDFQELKERYSREVKKNPRCDSVVVKDDISFETVQRFEAHSLDLPSFQIDVELIREYMYGPSLAHVLGYVGEVSEKQLNTCLFKNCCKGTIVGKAGIELAYDKTLRGVPGLKFVLVNSKGKEIRDYAVVKKVEPGFTLSTTIDLDLQEVLEEEFRGKTGAGIVLDPRTGGVLACVSFPSFDPNRFATGIPQELWRKLSRDPEHPLFNRTIQSRNSPGSVFKLIMTAGALQERLISPNTKYTCVGGARVNGSYFRCWREGGHGEVDLYTAIMKSCNVYFYRVGAKLEIEKIAKYARAFGLGNKTSIDIGPENSGLVPDPKWKRRTYHEPWFSGETISVAIGQGALGVTLIQMANLSAAIANEGVVYSPHLAKEIVDHEGRTVYSQKPKLLRKIQLRSSVWSFLKKGMWGVVNDSGTGRRSRVENFDVCGKTGTAQIVSEKKYRGREGELSKKKEHSWFVGFAPRENPELALAVFVAHGGHGGETAAPIAGSIFKRYFEMKNQEPFRQSETQLMASAETPKDLVN